MHWAALYIGKPWSQQNDCWAFFRYIQMHHYNRDLPIIDIDALSVRQVLKTFDTHPERKRWHQTATPQDGDGVLMGRNEHPIHVGIWLANEQRVLHCEQIAGVIAQDLPSLRAHGWSQIRFYTPCLP